MQQLLSGYGFDPAGIQCVSGTQQALLAAEAVAPDFVLTDWFARSELTGLDLMERVHVLNAQCRFAMLAADVNNSIRQEAQEAGAIFLMKKPCTAQDLRAALANAMELLIVENPKMAAHVNARRTQLAVTQASQIHIPKFEVGEQVLYRGRRESIKYVILRRGELVVQLNGATGLIPASNIQKSS